MKRNISHHSTYVYVLNYYIYSLYVVLNLIKDPNIPVFLNVDCT